MNKGLLYFGIFLILITIIVIVFVGLKKSEEDDKGPGLMFISVGISGLGILCIILSFLLPWLKSIS